MDIDAAALRWAKLPALERLARSLGVPVPALRDEYARHVVLRRDAAKAIEEDRRRAAAEERRVMDEKKIAAEIADALGETGKRPRRQIARIVALMGEAWTRAELAETLAVVGYPVTPINTREDGLPRTLGGSFFVMARAKASEEMKHGNITRREFFRCFFDRPRAARDPKPPTPPKVRPAKPVRRVETRAPQAQSKPRRQVTVPEVVTIRRRS